MKMIVAVIQPDRLDQVRKALVGAEITRITINRVTGHGRAKDMDLYRGQEVTPNLLPKIRVEVAVNDDFVEVAVNAILSQARHGDGELGDGKIFILPLDDCIRIRTGERGGDAI